jgi:hypothetical protein
MRLLQDNGERLAAVARALGPLHARAVYVGGAVVGFYADREPQEELRITKYVDFFLEIATLSELEDLRLQLRQQGFQQSAEDPVLCRFRLDDIRVDVMATRELAWAPANPWFEPGLQHLWKAVWDGIDFHLLSAPFFLATKLSAFNSRGGSDPRASHDIEDMVYVLQHREGIGAELAAAPEPVRVFLNTFAKRVLEEIIWQEAVMFNLPLGRQMQSFARIQQICRTLLKP